MRAAVLQAGGRDRQRAAGGVSWNAATEFVKRAGLRLPSEAEWEYACRAATTTKFTSGETPAELQSVAWCLPAKLDLAGRGPSSSVHAVAQKDPNAFGLFDVHGNVSEWCQDVWIGGYRGAPSDGSAREGAKDSEGRERILRGGNFHTFSEECAAGARGHDAPDAKDDGYGLRPAASLP